MMLTEAWPKRNSSSDEHSCCAFCCAPMVWVDPLLMLLKDAKNRNKKLKRLVADPGLDKEMLHDVFPTGAVNDLFPAFATICGHSRGLTKFLLGCYIFPAVFEIGNTE
jgi:hypothetical protein